MLKLPTEELLEKRLPEVGLQLNDRYYGEEYVADAKLDSVITGVGLEEIMENEAPAVGVCRER